MSRILPILFNTDMVKAILDGRKTVTRRVIKFPPNKFTGKIPISDDVSVYKNTLFSEEIIFHEEPHYCFDVKPQYHSKDIIYVRETWQYLHKLDGNEQIIENTGKYYYTATDTLPSGGYIDSRGITHETIPWRPSIYMPKAAARIWLKVTDVRVERLQDMWASDVPREGLLFIKPHTADEMLEEFRKLWNSTIKKPGLAKYGWEANPWVWVIEFERCEKPKEG